MDKDTSQNNSEINLPEDEEMLTDDVQAEQENTDSGAAAEQAGQTDDAAKKIQTLEDKLLRVMAEFDNFRKRTGKEKSSMYDNGAFDTILAILPMMDNFERALQSVSEEEKESSFFVGIQMIYRQMMESLQSLGVKEIESVGMPFDPNFHAAVLHVDDGQYGENEIIEDLQKGYMYKDRVLRHSTVKVAN